MNVFNKITLQSLLGNRTRTVVTIIGVILSVAMITAVTTLIASLQNYLLEDAITRDGDWHVEFMEVDTAFAQARAGDEALKSAAVMQNVGYALLDGGQNPYKPYVAIVGYDEESFRALPVKLLSGRLPQNSGEIVVPARLNEEAGVAYKVGDRVTFALGSRLLGGEKRALNAPYQSGEDEGGLKETFRPETEKTYRVVGICDRLCFQDWSNPAYPMVTKMDPSAAAGGGSFSVFAKLKHPSRVYRYAEDTAGDYVYQLNADVLRLSGISNNNSYNSVLHSLGAILIALIMAGSILLIYNAFAISVSERSRQFGILSSVGATGKQLRNSVLFEGICIALCGILPGIFIGLCGIGITLSLVGWTFAFMLSGEGALSLHISVPALVIAGVVGLVTILISAYIPARKAGAGSVMERIRQTDAVKIQAKTVKTTRFTLWLFGLEGVLARKNFKRNKRRYRSTIISLFVSVVLFVSASSFSSYLKLGSAVAVEDTGYDIALSIPNTDDEDVIPLYDKLKEVNGVTESSYQSTALFETTIPEEAYSARYLAFLGPEEDLSAGRSGRIHFVEDSTYRQYIKDLGLPLDEYNGESAKMVAVAKISQYDAKTQRYLSFDFFKNASMSLKITFPEAREGQADAAKDIDVTFVDEMPKILSETRTSGIMLFAPYAAKARFAQAEESWRGSELTFLSEDPTKSVVEMEQIMKESGDTIAEYGIYNVADGLERNRNIILMVNVFTFGFVMLISLIAIANVFNTISTGIRLRRREFAMLRSVGMGSRAFHKIMGYECVFYGLRTLLFGIPAACIVSWLIYRAASFGADVPFTLPFASIGISIFSVFFVVFVTTLYAIRMVKRENIIEALREDGV